MTRKARHQRNAWILASPDLGLHPPEPLLCCYIIDFTCIYRADGARNASPKLPTFAEPRV
jgi:hypothetical protein